MKEPTTEFSKSLVERITINREFLLNRGWELKDEYPLTESFQRINNPLIICSIGMYGSFSICELHWINKTPESHFSALNPDLKEEDYNAIIRMLGLNIKTHQQL